MTSRQFSKRIKEHIPKSIDEFCKMSTKENKTKRVVNVSKICATAEYLVNIPDCVNNWRVKHEVYFVMNTLVMCIFEISCWVFKKCLILAEYKLC